MVGAYVMCVVIFWVCGVSSNKLTCKILEMPSFPCITEHQRCYGREATTVNQYQSEAQPRPQFPTLLPRITELKIDPYQRACNITGTLFPGLAINISIDASRISGGIPGVELSYSVINGSAECITMTTRNLSVGSPLRNRAKKTKFTFNVDLLPMPSSPGNWVFKARSLLIGRTKMRSPEYSERRISLDKTKWASSPLNSSQWSTVIVYRYDSQSRRVGVRFALPPPSFNMTHFEVRLKKLVTLQGSPRPTPPTKTVINTTIISQNFYEFTNVSAEVYAVYVRAKERRTESDGNTQCQCLLAGVCAKCLETRTHFFEIKEFGENERNIVQQTSWNMDDWTVHIVQKQSNHVQNNIKTRQESKVSDNDASSTTGNDAVQDSGGKHKDKATVVFIAVVAVFGIVQIVVIATVCYICGRRSRKKAPIANVERRTITSGVEDSDTGDFLQELGKGRGSLTSKGSNSYNHPTSAAGDSGVESIGLTQENTKLMPLTSDKCNYLVTGSDVTSVAVTLGGGTSAPPEGVVSTNQRPRYPMPNPSAYRVDTDQEKWAYSTTPTYKGLRLREDDDVSM